MADILSPTGIEKPIGGEQHSRAMVNRNYDRVNQIAIDAVKYSRGIHTTKKIVANGIGLSALSVVENIASFAFLADRKYRIIWQGGQSLSAAGNYFDLAISTCSTADAAGLTTGLTTIQQRSVTNNAASFGEGFYVEAIYLPTADTTLQVKFTVSRTVGAGTWTLQASATAPAWYYIEDCGKQV